MYLLVVDIGVVAEILLINGKLKIEFGLVLMEIPLQEKKLFCLKYKMV